MTTWYFAYGSNLDFVQMRGRCPTAQFVCRAVLKDHVLAFNSRSSRRNCGVADVVPRKGHDVWGVVYQFEDQDLAALDAAEGYGPGFDPERNAYNRDDTVRVFAENDERQPLRVSIYFAVKQQNPPLPSAAYLRQIIDGAKFWKLPPRYIESLQQIPVER
jgi:gamma-glutamylcyclotransferase